MRNIIIAFCTFFVLFFIPFTSDAAPQCDGNRAPNLQNNDPACYTSHTTTSSSTTWEKVGSEFVSTCKWTLYCRNCSYPCNNRRGGACKANFYKGSGSGCRITHWCDNMGSPPQYGYYRDIYGHVTRTSSNTTRTCYYRVVDEWSACDVTTGLQSAISTSQKSRSGTDCHNYHQATTRPCAVCTPGSNIDITRMPTTSGICAFGNPQMPRLVGNNWVWQCLGNYNDIYDDAACSAPNSADGVCSSEATGIYAWHATAFRDSLCTPGIPSITPDDFPGYGETVSWTCGGIGSGASTLPNACRATRGVPPPCDCGDADGRATSTMPSSALCDVGNASSVAGSGTAWTWACGTTYTYDGKTLVCTEQAQCSADCIILTINAPNFVYLNETDATVDVSVTVDGMEHTTDAQCTINGQSVRFSNDSDTSDSIEISVPGGGIELDAACVITDPCGGNSGNEAIFTSDPKTVGTMCVARSCNSQGTCQAVPQPASNVSECKSTCNSDADCSTGRMIETRP